MLRASWKSLMGRKLRLAMSALAIVLGVAFVSGSLIFTDMLSGAFNGIVNGTVADLNVQAKGQGDSGDATVTREVSPQTVAKVRAVDGVASAEGGIQNEATYLIGKNGKIMATQGPPSLGLSWVDGAAFGGQQGLHVVEGRKPTTWGEVVIDPPSLEKSGYRIGDTMKIATTGRYSTIRAKIVGTATWGSSGGTAGATYAIFDPRTAQKLFVDGKDAYQGIWVVVDKGADVGAVERSVAEVLPADLEVKRGDELAKTANEAISKGTGFISTFLLVFAAIALVVGSFLIVNTFSILVAQRSRELALLRALGASRRQVRNSVLLEAFVTGVVGSTVGLLAGVGIAMGIAALFRTLGLDIDSSTITIAPRTVLASYAVGMVVTMLAAYWPARRASSVPPVAAMTGDMMTGKAGLGRRAAVGVVMTVVGLGALAAGLFGDGLPQRMWWIGAGALVTLLGVATASPVLGRPVTWLLGRLYAAVFGTVGRLAHLNAVRNPRRTAATASALMIGLTLVTAMSVLGQSMKDSTHDLLTKNMRSDYIASSVSYGGFSTTVADDMKKVPGVAEVHRMRYVPAQVSGKRAYLNAMDRGGFDKILAQKLASGSLDDWKGNAAIYHPKQAEKAGVRLGQTVPAVIDGKKVSLKVVGILDRESLTEGIIVPLELSERKGSPVTDSMVAVTRAKGADAAEVRKGLDRTVADLPMVTVTDQQEFAAEQSKGVDQMLNIVYGLLALAIVIAVLGIVNTLALSVIERTREIGLLRAVGLGRGQLRSMIRLESVVIALLGSVLGVGMGLLFGVALQRSLEGEGLEVLAIPWGQLGAFLAVAAAVGVLAALWPAHRAARLDVLRAIQAD